MQINCFQPLHLATSLYC